MTDSDTGNMGQERPPPVTYANPRRTSPDKSVTLRHLRATRDSPKRHVPVQLSTIPTTAATKSHPHRPRPHHQAPHSRAKHSPPNRRNSSGESNETGISDPQKWFDGVNQNSKGHFDDMHMEIDTPFYQRETDSSNEEQPQVIPTQSPAYRFVQDRANAGSRPGVTQSSSADDFRSVIDDLTIENKRLKDELKRYRQMGPDSLRKDKLFEVKFHGMPSNKKRQLEATLRDFTTSIDGSTPGASPRKKKPSSLSKNIHSSIGGVSKHASSSSGSNSRPVDSAYASMSTGPSSSGPSLPQGSAAMQRSNNINVQNYLRDIPEGLWPRPTSLTETDKKKLVVRRLEHLFTGKLPGPGVKFEPQPVSEDVDMDTNTTHTSDDKAVLSIETNREANREAQIRPRDMKRKQSNSRDNGSASNTNSNSNGDQTDSRDNGNGSGGSGHVGNANTSSNTSLDKDTTEKSEQRPTRPRDLDPDREQVPADNMDYIRHLGLGRPDSGGHFSSRDVSVDTDGWVYLNLLCNLAQLHILNVTPDFIRSAVSEKSTKFQLSPDGRKIRWRGGDEGTKFSSDSSGSNSKRGESSDETDGSNSNNQRKKVKTSKNDVTGRATGSNFQQLRNQDSNSSDSFHYKPLFVHQQSASSDEQPSCGDETGSSYGPPEESNLGLTSRWGQSGVSGMSQRKRRRDGAIIYYSGAPFCTDLSGDMGGEASPDTYHLTSSGDQAPISHDYGRPPQVNRSMSGSSIPFRPLSTVDAGQTCQTSAMDLDDESDVPDLSSDLTDSDDMEANTDWSDSDQSAQLVNLEACGLGGVYPDDHFVLIVSTRRPKEGAGRLIGRAPSLRPRLQERNSNDTTDSRATADSIISKLATMTTSSPRPPHMGGKEAPSTVGIEYLNGRIRRLPPVPLPPPAFYIPSNDSLDSAEMDSDYDVSDGLISRQVLANHPMHSIDDELSGNDEEDELDDDDDEFVEDGSIASNEQVVPPITEVPSSSGRRIPRLSKMTTGSSAATAGGAASGYNSSVEDA